MEPCIFSGKKSSNMLPEGAAVRIKDQKQNTSERSKKMENEKLNEMLKKLWGSLTEEQKEKAKACKTTDELVKLAASEGIELPDELLDAVAGGVVVEIKGTGTWSAFDNKGDYIGNAGSLDGAKEMARSRGADTSLVDKAQLDRIRAHSEYERF